MAKQAKKKKKKKVQRRPRGAAYLTRYIGIRITDAEWHDLGKLTASQGQSVSEWFRAQLARCRPEQCAAEDTTNTSGTDRGESCT